MRVVAWCALIGLVLVTPVVSAAQQAGPPSRPAPQPAPMTASAPPTFTKDVAPILYKHCTSCHRPDTVAPMSLITYADARPYAKGIRNHVIDREMPPWHADESIGRFANARILSEAERTALITWANTGAREGDPRDLPPAPTYNADWSIGQPDLVLSMDREFEVPAEGTIEYQHFRIPSGLTRDVWIQALELRSTAPEVVHHVLVFDKPPTPSTLTGVFDRKAEHEPRRKNESGTEDGALLMAFASGTGPRVLPVNTARKLVAGSVITLQLHYSANGKAARDRTSLGLKFASAPPVEQLQMDFFANQTLRIPAGADNHRVDSEIGFKKPIKLYGIAPHAHLRGKAFEYRLAYPDGREEKILSVPRYDFAWQVEYMFEKPLEVPSGARLRATAWYDNSRNNRDNPDPTLEVTWGGQTWEEMMFTWFSFSLAGADAPAATSSGGR